MIKESSFLFSWGIWLIFICSELRDKKRVEKDFEIGYRVLSNKESIEKSVDGFDNFC